MEKNLAWNCHYQKSTFGKGHIFFRKRKIFFKNAQIPLPDLHLTLILLLVSQFQGCTVSDKTGLDMVLIQNSYKNLFPFFAIVFQMYAHIASEFEVGNTKIDAVFQFKYNIADPIPSIQNCIVNRNKEWSRNGIFSAEVCSTVSILVHMLHFIIKISLIFK